MTEGPPTAGVRPSAAPLRAPMTRNRWCDGRRRSHPLGLMSQGDVASVSAIGGLLATVSQAESTRTGEPVPSPPVDTCPYNLWDNDGHE